MKLKIVHREYVEHIDETLVVRDAAECAVPSVDDRVRIGDEFYHVWRVFHAFDCEGVDRFDAPDETHVLVVTFDEATELSGGEFEYQYP